MRNKIVHLLTVKTMMDRPRRIGIVDAALTAGSVKTAYMKVLPGPAGMAHLERLKTNGRGRVAVTVLRSAKEYLSIKLAHVPGTKVLPPKIIPPTTSAPNLETA